jgi:hypothetical protein
LIMICIFNKIWFIQYILLYVCTIIYE